METNTNYEELLRLIEDKNFRVLKQTLEGMNEVDIGIVIEEMPREKALIIYRALPKEIASDVFAECSVERQKLIIESITDQEVAYIIEELFVDDAVDMLEELPANVVKKVMKNATPETRNLINQFLKYPENSAGSIMTAEYTSLKKDMTVKEAIKHIRKTGEDRETIYTCYVIDEKRFLEGVVTVKTLLLESDDSLIKDIMDTEVIDSVTTDDREEVARLCSKYDLLSIPVVDLENRLVGIITVDDIVDVIEQEATEDFEKMAAMAPSDKPYLKTGVFTLAKNRIVWLLLLMISAMITGGILERYEVAFSALPLLVTFIPMLTDTGGNAGSQSSALIIRGMAVAEIQTKDFFRVFLKELQVSILVGVVLSLVNFVRLSIMYPGNMLLALTVAISLFATVVIAKTIGGILPMLANMLKVDPAIMAAPLITTIVDAVSLVVYFSLAQAIIPM